MRLVKKLLQFIRQILEPVIEQLPGGGELYGTLRTSFSAIRAW